MKKVFLVIIEILIIFLVEYYWLFSNSSQVYYDIIDGYAVQKNSWKDIVIVKNEKKVIEDYILEVQYDDRYIFLKTLKNDKLRTINRTNMEEYINGNINIIKEQDILYFFIDTDNDKIRGPYALEDFHNIFEKININYDKLIRWERMY